MRPARCARRRWERLTEAAGIDARDAVGSTGSLPSSADLDKPAGFIDRVIGGDTSGIDIDAVIAEFEKDIHEHGSDEGLWIAETQVPLPVTQSPDAVCARPGDAGAAAARRPRADRLGSPPCGIGLSPTGLTSGALAEAAAGFGCAAVFGGGAPTGRCFGRRNRLRSTGCSPIWRPPESCAAWGLIRAAALAVRVHGCGPLSDLLTEGLRCSGARVSKKSSHANAAGAASGVDTVVLADTLAADPRLLRDLHTAGVPHLPMRVRATGASVVGPLVIPGRTSCLVCADLHRTDRDPVWPALAAQLREVVGWPTDPRCWPLPRWR